jgi:hypothetical protein
MRRGIQIFSVRNYLVWLRERDRQRERERERESDLFSKRSLALSSRSIILM